MRAFRALESALVSGRRDRIRRAAMAGVVGVAGRGIGILVVLVSVPLTYRYLGAERYGAWMTLTSMQTMASFSDLGIGNGLINAVAEADGKNDRAACVEAVSSAFFMLLGLAAVLAVAFAIAAPFVPWASVTNVPADLGGQVTATAAVVVAAFVAGLPLSVVQRFQMGRQAGFIGAAWSIAGSLLGLGGVAVAVVAHAALPVVALGAAAGPLIAAFANTVTTFGFKAREFRPRWGGFRRHAAHRLFRIGGLFFVLQLASSVAYSADNVVVAQVLGAAAVPQYAVPMKLFGFVAVFVGLAVSPLWPAYAEAIASGDGQWVSVILRRSLSATTVFAVVAATTLLFSARPLIHLWAGASITPSQGLLFGCASWAVLGAVGTTCAMFLNGAKVVRPQVIIAITMAIANIFLSVWLARRIGVAGVVWGTVISYAVLVAVPYGLLLPRTARALARTASLTLPELA